MGDDDFLLLQLVLIMTEMFFLIFSGSASFSLKVQIINISGFRSHTASISAPQVLP